MRKLSARFLLLLAVLLLAACHKGEQEKLVEEGATPQAAMESAIRDIRHGDFDQLRRNLLPPAAYQDLRDAWDAGRHREQVDVTAQERQQFARTMRELTEPDAKKKQFAKIEPLLDKWETRGRQQLPMAVGVMQMVLGTQITQSKALSPAQKTQARHLVQALADWVQHTDWGDKDKARQAVGVAVDTARALNIQTLDDAYALDYDEAMQRYATAWKGVRELLDVYGLSLDQALDSARVKVLEQGKDKATVEVEITVLEQPLASTFEMVRKGKRWYFVDALDWWHREQARLATAASAAAASSSASAGSSAPAASAPVPAASVAASASR